MHVLRWADGRYSVMRGIRVAPVIEVPVWTLGHDGAELGTIVHRFKHVGAAHSQLNDCAPVEVYEHAGVSPPEAECP
jgi:hypothetical protein